VNSFQKATCSRCRGSFHLRPSDRSTMGQRDALVVRCALMQDPVRAFCPERQRQCLPVCVRSRIAMQQMRRARLPRRRLLPQRRLGVLRAGLRVLVGCPMRPLLKIKLHHRHRRLRDRRHQI
jgi:hypothetical protein